MDKRCVYPNGRRIRELRVNQAWSQEELAARAGLAKNTVQEVERRNTAEAAIRRWKGMFHGTLERIAGALFVSSHELLLSGNPCSSEVSASCGPSHSHIPDALLEKVSSHGRSADQLFHQDLLKAASCAAKGRLRHAIYVFGALRERARERDDWQGFWIASVKYAAAVSEDGHCDGFFRLSHGRDRNLENQNRAREALGPLLMRRNGIDNTLRGWAQYHLAISLLRLNKAPDTVMARGILLELQQEARCQQDKAWVRIGVASMHQLGLLELTAGQHESAIERFSRAMDERAGDKEDYRMGLDLRRIGQAWVCLGKRSGNRELTKRGVKMLARAAGIFQAHHQDKYEKETWSAFDRVCARL